MLDRDTVLMVLGLRDGYGLIFAETVGVSRALRRRARLRPR